MCTVCFACHRLVEEHAVTVLNRSDILLKIFDPLIKIIWFVIKF